MLLLVYFGKTFGMSSNLRTMCSMFGASKYSDFFKVDWREQKWNLAIVLGAIFGGFFAFHVLSNHTIVKINPDTVEVLKEMRIDEPNGKLVPNALFGLEVLSNVKGILFLFLGGILIGFGTRYAGGCTSGHAISGLSNFQIPSLIAVIGFFIGGLITVHFILPFLFN